MRIVVDTSVIIAVIGNEPEKPALIDHTRGAEIVAPQSVHWEVGNAFSAMLKQRRIAFSLAQQALEVYKQIRLQFVDVDLMRSLELADRFGIYAYDAYIIACALDQQCPLLALDRGLFRAARGAGVEVLEMPS